MHSEVQHHFDSIAEQYDFWKKKNWYYHQNLKRLLRSKIRKDASVVEIGCGTGDLLASLDPVRGLGIDLSPEMIHIAQGKYASNPCLRFMAQDITQDSQVWEGDIVFMADVLEHLEAPGPFLRHLSQRMRPGSRLVITVANPFWEPVLLVAEKLKMKMPEGPHQRLPLKATEKLFHASGFSIRERGHDLLCPISLPFSDWINHSLGRMPLIRRFGFIIFWVLEK